MKIFKNALTFTVVSSIIDNRERERGTKKSAPKLKKYYLKRGNLLCLQ